MHNELLSRQCVLQQKACLACPEQVRPSIAAGASMECLTGVSSAAVLRLYCLQSPLQQYAAHLLVRAQARMAMRSTATDSLAVKEQQSAGKRKRQQEEEESSEEEEGSSEEDAEQQQQAVKKRKQQQKQEQKQGEEGAVGLDCKAAWSIGSRWVSAGMSLYPTTTICNRHACL